MYILRYVGDTANRDIIKDILTSKYWLLATLSGTFFFFFALNRGGYAVFIHASLIFLVFNIVLGKYSLKKIPVIYFILTATCVVLIIVSFIVSPHGSHIRWMRNLGRMLIIIFSIHLLSKKTLNEHIVSITFIGIVFLAVCWQFGAFYFLKMPYGTFSNLHYLSSFAVLTIPPILYGMLYLPRWYKIVAFVILTLDINLLMQSGSRPAIIAILGSSLAILFFFIRGRAKWIGILLILLICATLYFTGYAGISSEFEELFVNVAKEERVQLWGQAWNIIKKNTVLEWLCGHGIQQFPVSYKWHPSSSEVFTVFPHNHFLEILYLNGVVGVVLIFGGLAFLFVGAIRIASIYYDRRKRTLIHCTLVVFLSWLIHSGLTFPFYSKYSVLPMAFILGTMLVLVSKPVDDRNAG